MKENEKNMLLVKIQDKYIYDNGFIKGVIRSANAEHIIAKNYVKFTDIIDAYAIGDKILDTLEKMSINPETENQKNQLKDKNLENKKDIKTVTIEFKNKDKFEKYIKAEDEYKIKEINDIYNEYLNIRKEAYENFSFYYEVMDKLSHKYDYEYFTKGIGNIYNKLTKEIISLLNKKFLSYEEEIINLINNIQNLNF